MSSGSICNINYFYLRQSVSSMMWNSPYIYKGFVSHIGILLQLRVSSLIMKGWWFGGIFWSKCCVYLVIDILEE